jgi:hypothetical protein
MFLIKNIHLNKYLCFIKNKKTWISQLGLKLRKSYKLCTFRTERDGYLWYYEHISINLNKIKVILFEDL